MLEELLIRDVGIIDEITLELAPGLNVLSGETGAGKTMVVSALELLLGARADADLVRAGAPALLVEGRFRPPPPEAGEWVAGDDELVVSREVSGQSGGSIRSRARLNGRLAPASSLAQVVGSSVELHGQSESVRLASPALQLELLDRFGGPDLLVLRERYVAAYERWRGAVVELDALQITARDRARELDRLEFELAEISAVDPERGEEDTLDDQLRRLEHAEALLGVAHTAAAAIARDGGARDALGTAVHALRSVAGVDEELDGLHARVEALAADAQDVGLELTRYADALDLDPRRLDALRERRAALGRLLRKYGPDTDAVLRYAEDARAQVESLRVGDERAGQLAGHVDALHEEALSCAAALREQRRDAAQALQAATHAHLAGLALADARLQVTVQARELRLSGGDEVAFLLAANAGEPLLPLGKAASGGERSRIALALRLALADADDTGVLVFDEVDAGIGGATGLAVGRKLARLARGRQVLCVTHLAQLAAFADAHFVVTKVAQDGRTVATVRGLSEQERVSELSRMLSGTPDSARATQHAAELRALALQQAGAPEPALAAGARDARTD